MKRLVLLLTVAMVFPLAPVASDDAKTAQAPEQTGDQTGPQAYQHPIIVLDQNNTQYRIGAHAPDSIPIKSRFDKGVVVDMSAERNNPSGLQRYVAVRYPVALGYGGEVVSKGEVIVIYANLKQINVEMGANVVQGQELGMTFSKKLTDVINRIASIDLGLNHTVSRCRPG